MKNCTKGYHRQNPGSSNGTAKVHKLTENEGVDNISLKPMTVKYLADLSGPLRKSRHTVSNTEDFISRLQKEQQFPKGLK